MNSEQALSYSADVFRVCTKKLARGRSQPAVHKQIYFYNTAVPHQGHDLQSPEHHNNRENQGRILMNGWDMVQCASVKRCDRPWCMTTSNVSYSVKWTCFWTAQPTSWEVKESVDIRMEFWVGHTLVKSRTLIIKEKPHFSVNNISTTLHHSLGN